MFAILKLTQVFEASGPHLLRNPITWLKCKGFWFQSTAAYKELQTSVDRLTTAPTEGIFEGLHSVDENDSLLQSTRNNMYIALSFLLSRRELRWTSVEKFH